MMLFTVSEHYHLKTAHIIQQRLSVFSSRPTKVKHFWLTHLPQKQVADFQRLFLFVQMPDACPVIPM